MFQDHLKKKMFSGERKFTAKNVHTYLQFKVAVKDPDNSLTKTQSIWNVEPLET
jgi:hypothetical protein